MTGESARTFTAVRPAFPLASRWSRFVAWFVDLVLNVCSAAPGVVLATVTGEGEDGRGELRFLAFALACYLGLWTYQAWLRAVQGQTIGKKALGIRIVSCDDGSNPGFWRAVFLRDLVPWFIGLFVGPLFAIVDDAFIFGRERRCVHDYMAATIVVHARQPLGADQAHVFD